MRGIRLLLLMLIASGAVASSAGDIQVSCTPGIRVYLDGRLMGTSNPTEDGLYLVDVPRGAHTVRLEKEGFLPLTYEVEVFDAPIEVEVGELTPAPPVPRAAEPTPTEVRQQVGSLVVTSAPQNCVVEIDGRSETKTTPTLSIGTLAAGEHTISFSKPGYDRISGVVKVQPGAEVRVRGNLIAGAVEVAHEGKGSLTVISDPSVCSLIFRGETWDKTTTRFNLSHIPAGEHDLTLVWKDRAIKTSVLIANGQRTVVTVSFMPGADPLVVAREPE